MGLNTKITNSFSITTTPTDITSTKYAYHHIKIFFTFTLAAGDSYEFIVYHWDPVATSFVRGPTDVVDFVSVGNTTTASLQEKTWEMSPTPGEAARVTVTKLTGNNGTANYEIIQVT